jgi:hypothetical protein
MIALARGWLACSAAETTLAHARSGRATAVSGGPFLAERLCEKTVTKP